MNRFAVSVTALCSAFVLASSSAMTAFSVGTIEKFPSGTSYRSLDGAMDRVIDHADDDPADSYIFFRGDEIVREYVYGCEDIENGVFASEETVFDWGGCTTLFTWISVMQLAEDGVLDLDADIRQYFPDDFLKKLRYDDPITLTQIMDHKAGWSACTYSTTVYPDDASQIVPLEDILRRSEPEQTYKPGEVTAYSDWGAALAGYIIERVSGMSYAEYVGENIFKPLGMEYSAIAADLSDNEWVRDKRMGVKSYEMKLFIDLLYEPSKYNTEFNMLSPSGSAVGTIGDLARFMQALVSDEHPLFDSAETQDKLFSGTSFYGTSDIPYSSYGFGVTESDNARVFGYSGGSGYHTVDVGIDPVSKYGYVCLSNSRDGAFVSPGMFAFGDLTDEKYPSAEDDGGEISGYYLNAQRHVSGPLKIASLLYSAGLIDIANSSDNSTADSDELELAYIGDGVYKVCDEDGNIFTLLSEKEYSDGTKGVNMGENDLIQDSYYMHKVILLTVYIGIAALSIPALLVYFKLMRAGKIKLGAGEITAILGHAAKPVSFLALITLLEICVFTETSSFPTAVIPIMSGIQIVCMAVMAVSIIGSVANAIKSKPTVLGYARNIANIAGNVLTVSAVIYFELYKFW